MTIEHQKTIKKHFSWRSRLVISTVFLSLMSCSSPSSDQPISQFPAMSSSETPVVAENESSHPVMIFPNWVTTRPDQPVRFSQNDLHQASVDQLPSFISPPWEIDPSSHSWIKIDQHEFIVSLSTTPQQLMQGLMMVEEMPLNAGMLFIHPRPSTVSYWMKDVFIPLDIIYIGQDRKIQSIYTVPPCPPTEYICPSYQSPGDTLMVLEIHAGLSQQLGIYVGDEIEFSPIINEFFEQQEQ